MIYQADVGGEIVVVRVVRGSCVGLGSVTLIPLLCAGHRECTTPENLAFGARLAGVQIQQTECFWSLSLEKRIDVPGLLLCIRGTREVA